MESPVRSVLNVVSKESVETWAAEAALVTPAVASVTVTAVGVAPIFEVGTSETAPAASLVNITVPSAVAVAVYAIDAVS